MIGVFTKKKYDKMDGNDNVVYLIKDIPELGEMSGYTETL